MKKIKKLVSSFLIVALTISILPQAYAAAKTNYAAIDAENQKKILVYVNQYRQKRGLPPLKMNKLISQEAERHSRDMGTHRVPFGHQYFSKRIKRIFDDIQQCHGGAENVAYNYRDAKIVVEQWLTSPGHRRNIEGRYNLTGIGLARDSRGKLYFTQIFVRTDNAAYLG